MIFRQCLIIVVMFCSCIVAGPLEDAEQAYQQKQYSESISLYESLLNRYPTHSGLLYNLGNSYIKNEQLGLAITMYRRALRFEPRDKAIKTNLDLARKLVLDETKASQAPLMAWFFGFLNMFTLNEFYIVLFLFLFLLNGLLVIRFLDKYSGLLRHLFITVGLSLFVFLLFFISKFNYDSDSSHGVLIIKKVEVRSGPSETLPTLFYIHEGVEFEILKRVNGWSEIQLSNGYNGWLIKTSYLTI